MKEFQNFVIKTFNLDFRSLALFRMALAGTILFDLFSRSRFIDGHYTDEGFNPALVAHTWNKFLPHFLSGTYDYQFGIFALTIAFATMLLVGYRTRLATFFVWFLLVSLNARDPFVRDGSDSFAMALLIWSFFLPVGAHWSVDNHTKRRSNLLYSSDKSPVYFSIATAAITLQFVFLYLNAGLCKINSEWLIDRTVLIEVFRQVSWGHPLGAFLGQFPEMLKVVTPMTVAFELIAPGCLLLSMSLHRFRMTVLASFWFFQLLLGLSIQLNMLPWVMTAPTLMFIPTSIWDKYLPKSNQFETNLQVSNFFPNFWKLPKQVIASQILVVLLVSYLSVGFLNYYGKFYSATNSVGWKIGLLSTWEFYSGAFEYNSEFFVKAKLKNGKMKTIWNSLDETHRWKESNMNLIFPTYRFRFYLDNILNGDKERKNAFLSWVQRNWNNENRKR